MHRNRKAFHQIFSSLALAFAIILYSGTASAVTGASWVDRKISAIEIHGLKRIERDAVLEKLRSKVGTRYKPEWIRADIQDLYRMGYFDSIEVKGASTGAGTIKVAFFVKERPVISKLIFEGNEKIDSGDLRDVIKVNEWEILDINRIREDVERIQEHYEEKGFYLAKVRFELVPISDDEVQLVYKINDYEKVKIKKITFLNNKVFSDDQLKAVLAETREGGLFSFMTGSGSFKESSFKQDLQRLTYWYLEHGYVKFRFDNPSITVSTDKKWLYITIYVEEGDQYSIGSIDFSGDLLFSKEELREDLKMVEGKKFKITDRNHDIQTLTEKVQDLGYAFANVVPQMNIDEEKKLLHLDYSFEKGKLVYFGEINIIGNLKTHDKVIRRELRVYEGELFSGSKLRISRERVERLGFFAPGEVIFNTQVQEGSDDVLNLEIRVKERSTGTITLGAGYSSFDKFFFSTQISEINFLGRGQTLTLQAQYAASRGSRSFSFGFTEPYLFDTPWSGGVELFYKTSLLPDRYTTRKLGFDLRFGYPIQDDLFFYLTYKHENLKVENLAVVDPEASLDSGLLSSAIFSLIRDKRNNRFETTSGNYQSAVFEAAGLGGDKKFLKLRLNNRIYFQLFDDLIFRNSIEYGHIAKIDDAEVPPSERFYLGGPNNMKGFDFYNLGPKKTVTKLSDNSSIVVPAGGLVQMFALFELEYPLIREAGLKFVTFFDAGNAFSRFPGSGAEPFSIRMDAGLGLRWFSPIGPLRFEWGYPLNPQPGEKTSLFQFFIGPPF